MTSNNLCAFFFNKEIVTVIFVLLLLSNSRRDHPALLEYTHPKRHSEYYQKGLSARKETKKFLPVLFTSSNPVKELNEATLLYTVT